MSWETIQPFVTWLGNTSLGQWLGQSTTRIAWLFILHLFGLTMLLGTTLLMSMRLLGFALRRQPIAELRKAFARWNLLGLGLMLASGFLIFTGGAEQYFQGAWFRTKMEFLFFALVFHFTVFRMVTRADEGRFGGLFNKLTGLISLVLWFGVAVSGRAIGFS